MNSKDHPSLHTPSKSGFTAAVSDDPVLDGRLCAQLERLARETALRDPHRHTMLARVLQATLTDRLRFAQARGWTASLSDEEGARVLAGASK